MEAITAGKEVESLLVQKGLSNELNDQLLQLANQRGIVFSKVPIEKLNRITRKNHQGAICFISPIAFQSLDNIVSQQFENGKDPFILVLDGITDMRNFGAVIRSAECAGVDAIVIPARGSARIGSDAMKTSAGALNYVPICKVGSVREALRFLKNSGLQIIACTEKSSRSIFDMNLNSPTAFILGSEENGISNDHLKLADELAGIPLRGKIESLNVSVAAAVAMYEWVRQQNTD